MAFPPGFDNVWDITQPPDTQLANLLGQDIRNLKDDVMQRLSLLSGLFANRPTPEIVNATWGGAGFGLLYFSTDTHQIFQWNGAIWNDVSSSFAAGTIFKDSVAHVHTGDTTEDVIYTAPVGANSMGLNGILQATVIVDTIVPSGSGSLLIRFGGVLTVTVAFTAAFANRVDLSIGNKGVANSQFWFATVYGVNGIFAVDGVIAVDTTVLQNLTVAVKNGANTDTQTFKQCLVQSV